MNIEQRRKDRLAEIKKLIYEYGLELYKDGGEQNHNHHVKVWKSLLAGMQNGFRQTSYGKKLQSAQAYAAKVRAQKPEMQVRRLT